MKAYKLICPVCQYTNTILSRHGRFYGVEDEVKRCPACNREVVAIVEKTDLPDSTDYNVFKKM